MPSAFAEILAELVGQIPGALGAVFLDWDGEAVDQFSHIPLFDILLVGAHWSIVLRLVHELVEKHAWGNTQLVVLNGPETDIIIKPITDDYAVVLAMKSGHHLAHAISAIDSVTGAIEREM
jgi:predicted regulator of Ras-like GTPase activity (Roadblock/LC7/MglB family)